MNSNDSSEVIRRLAAEVVADVAPAEKAYFPVVWEELLARGFDTGQPPKRRLVTGWFIEHPGELKLVSPLVVFIISEVYWELNQRFGPPEEEAVREATVAAAKRMGAPDTLAKTLGQRLPGKFRDVLMERTRSEEKVQGGHTQNRERGLPGPICECVAWFNTRGTSHVTRREGAYGQLSALFSLQKEAFDFLVDFSQKGIWIRNSKEFVRVAPRIQKLLVLFLLHRGKRIPTLRAGKWVFPRGSSVVGADLKRVRSNLKLAVHELKDKVRTVGNFVIPDLGRDEDYYCLGSFTFCVLMTGAMEVDLAECRLRPDF